MNYPINLHKKMNPSVHNKDFDRRKVHNFRHVTQFVRISREMLWNVITNVNNMAASALTVNADTESDDEEGAGTQELDNNIGGSDLELSELDSESDDDIPLADIIPLAGLVDRGGGDAGHAHNDRRWTADLKPIRVKDFEDIAGPTTALDAEKKELDFFHLIFPESLYDKLAQQTNTYAAKRIREKADSSWQATSPTEIKTFLGIVIFMSLLDLPTAKMYWSSDWMFQTSLPTIMTRLRFEKLAQYFHLNDSTTNPPKGSDGHDKLHHVRPVLDTIQGTIASQYTLHQDCAIDEAMIAYKGRLSFKQYMPAKPVKFGIKVWERADSTNGYVNKLQIYTGRAGNEQGKREVGLAARVVTDLTRDIVGSSRHVYVDNFFSSPQLFSDLLKDGLYACGTCRINRKGFPSGISKENVKKKGDFTMLQSGNLVASVWFDNKPVTFLSTNADPTTLHEVRRKNKDGSERVQLAPSVVKMYGDNMNAVDRADQLRMQYTCARKCYKWWKYVNSFILMKESPSHQRKTRTGRVKHLTQLEFRERLCKQLIGDTRSVRKRRRVIQHDVAGLSYSHMPVKVKVNRCRQCGKVKIRKESSFGCRQCGVNLCVLCFEPFHKDLVPVTQEE
ncbi:piggyBac transposable element-derived protein 4-like isoform X2 [Pecten maximus]|uniref:piggyBac transposable element-derived protein 4-like isoform X2 n=1 Tax=Pecten maximus TaxID=6579 RepID=UPI0014588599|nr:piggyBac transposable element-derived protein 4-like isoform X2 [Pecten maximus]